MHYRMDVVGHHRPSVQGKAVVGKETKRSSDESGNARILQPAFSVAGIQIGIHALGIPVEQRFLLLPGQWAILVQGLLDDGFALALQLEQDFPRKCPNQSEGDEVAGPLTLEVR